MRRHAMQTQIHDPAEFEQEIQRRLRRAKAKIYMFDFLFLAGAAIAIFLLI